MKKLVIARRISQSVFLSLFVYILWSTTYPLKGAISPQVLFKADPLLVFLTALSQRVFLPGLLLAAGMSVLTLVVGRFFCGWVCPLGTMIDAAGRLPTKKKILSNVQNRKLRLAKYGILGVMLLLAVFGIQAAWTMDPIVIMGRVVSLNVIPAVTMSVDKIFIVLIQKFGLYGGVYDVYRQMKGSLLGINVHFFANSLLTFGVFLVILSAGIWLTRFWCRALCPLGAFYAFIAKFSLLKRHVSGCSSCGRCAQVCRMGAIKKNVAYCKSECILCMDCVYDCDARNRGFYFTRSAGREPNNKKGISRRDFILILSSALMSLGWRWMPGKKSSKVNILRPPGAQNEPEFLNRCVRCGNCMKVCITNGLQPVMWEAGPQGIWTPQLIPEIGYCEYNCTLCGQVCPTQAIPQLPVEAKRLARIGIAKVDRTICLGWAGHERCLVCEEHCPVSHKAIKFSEIQTESGLIPVPVVDTSLCVGCGICQNKCPVRPARAIRVQSIS